MGLIAGTARAALIGALVGYGGYHLGHARGYAAGVEEGREAQRERDALIIKHEKAESARRLDTIAKDAYERMREEINKEASEPIDLSDEKYLALQGRKPKREGSERD